MYYILLLIAGLIVSGTHIYLVFKNKSNDRYSISEHAIADKKSHLVYFCAHVVANALFLTYAYKYLYLIQMQNILFGLIIIFAVFDIVQAYVPSKDKTEKLHFIAVYISWFMYQLAGILMLFWIDISQPYKAISAIILTPVILMFIYMHFRREKLWPCQLIMVPLYVLYLIVFTFGSTV